MNNHDLLTRDEVAALAHIAPSTWSALRNPRTGTSTNHAHLTHPALVAGIRRPLAEQPHRENAMSTIEGVALLDTLAAEHRTNIRICPRGDHLRVARAWRTECAGCAQPIPTGDIGPVTWDDQHGCGIGGWSHQHGCGTWNSPTEISLDIDPDTEITEEVVLGALTRLSDAIADEQREADDRIRIRLRRDLREAVAKRALLAAENPDTDGEDLDDQVLTGSETEPGVWRNYDGLLEAWDFDVASDDATITVDESEL